MNIEIVERSTRLSRKRRLGSLAQNIIIPTEKQIGVYLIYLLGMGWAGNLLH